MKHYRLWKKSLAMVGCVAALILVSTNHLVWPAAQAQEVQRLERGQWDDFNRQKLDMLIATYGKGSANYQAARPPYVVFDWDNTSNFLDVEEAVLIYQLQQLRFSATPAQLDAAIRTNIPVGDFKAEFNNAAGEPVNIDKIARDIVDSYTWLYNNYQGLQGTKSLQEVQENPHYQNFITKVRYLYEAIGGSFDVAVSYPWVTYLFVGMNRVRVAQLTKETIDWQLRSPIEKVKWTSPKELPGVAGVVAVSWKNGMRLVPEMQDLYAKFRAAGFDVWVCSASFVDVVQEISSNPKFGYSNSRERVLAMELERDDRGVIMAEFRRGYDQTQGPGKSKAINRFLVGRYGYGPIFIAGDSEGDQNMMQDFPDTQLVLIVNRLRGNDIGKFSAEAVRDYGKSAAKYLLQGRDDNKGVFIPSQENIPFGAETGQLLKVAK